MSRAHYSLMTPDLDLGDVPMVVSVWLARKGDAVIEGDRLVELLAGDVVVDVSAPVNGVLIAQHAVEDERIHPGQVLGVIAEAGEE